MRYLLLVVALVGGLPTAHAQEKTPEQATIALRRAGVKLSVAKGVTSIDIDNESDRASNDAISNVRFLNGPCTIDIGTSKARQRLAAIAGAKEAKRINIYGDEELSDDDLKFLSDHKHLRELSISGGKITDKGLVHLKTLVELENLRLSGTKVTQDGLDKLYESLPKCVGQLR